MPHTYAIGETVLDIIFEEDIPVSACIGGSMLNSAVSLGRMNMAVSMITTLGKDKPGRMAIQFLKSNGVDDSMIDAVEGDKTTIALAFLDDQKKASYEFYPQKPAEAIIWQLPVFEPGDSLLFGSVFSLRADMRPFIAQVLEAACKANVFSLYDPNFRKAHLHELDSLRAAIYSNMSKASLVRGSDEDFELICNLSDPDEIYTFVSRYCPNLIITGGPGKIFLYTPAFRKTYVVPEISAISTIGAGDSFNAGLLYGLRHLGKDARSLTSLSEQDWDLMVQAAIACSLSVCQSAENYVPVGFNPIN